MSIKKQLTSEIFISTQLSSFGFMFMTSDLSGYVYGDANSSSSSSLGSLGMAIFDYVWFPPVF